jgi:hypothetical protein
MWGQHLEAASEQSAESRDLQFETQKRQMRPVRVPQATCAVSLGLGSLGSESGLKLLPPPPAAANLDLVTS